MRTNGWKCDGCDASILIEENMMPLDWLHATVSGLVRITDEEVAAARQRHAERQAKIREDALRQLAPGMREAYASQFIVNDALAQAVPGSDAMSQVFVQADVHVCPDCVPKLQSIVKMALSDSRSRDDGGLTMLERLK